MLPTAISSNPLKRGSDTPIATRLSHAHFKLSEYEHIHRVFVVLGVTETPSTSHILVLVPGMHRSMYDMHTVPTQIKMLHAYIVLQWYNVLGYVTM